METKTNTYTEGIYSDSAANRKLGRVGMTYKEWEDLKNSNSEEKPIYPIKKEEPKIKEEVKNEEVINSEDKINDIPKKKVIKKTKKVVKK